MQRWALILLNYTFSIVYIKTQDFGNADVLSRLINQQVKPEEEFVVASLQFEYELNENLHESIDMLPVTINQIKNLTSSDPILRIVKQYIQDGSWPKEMSREVAQFEARKESLSIIDDCIMFQDRVVIPSILRNRVIKQFHRGHPGIVRMKAIARSFAYWPRIDHDIEEHVNGCNPCQSVMKNPTKNELESWPIPTKPWSRIHVDLAGPINNTYLFILVDAYSKYLEVIPVKTISSSNIIRILEEIFGRLGNCETIVSDNGTQFTSKLFEEFCAINNITHLRTAPYHPQSNGQAERFVDTVKRALKKMSPDGKNIAKHLSVFLQTHLSTPNPITFQSPFEMMFGRKMVTPLNAMKHPSERTVIKNVAQNEAFNKRHGAKTRKFLVNQKVFVKFHKQNKESWKEAVIVKPIGHAMYLVDFGDEHFARVHANQLRKNFCN